MTAEGVSLILRLTRESVIRDPEVSDAMEDWEVEKILKGKEESHE
jgi:hypothetical protein